MPGFRLQENICFLEIVTLGTLSPQRCRQLQLLLHCCDLEADAPKQIKISNIVKQDCLFSPQLANLCFFYNYFKRHYLIS